jgi:hypothetical protein
MSELKDLYTKTIKHDYNEIKHSPWYLAALTIRGAIEIDNHILRRNNDFSHIQELAKILEEYQLQDTDKAPTETHFPYLTFWKATQRKSDKKIKNHSELALEIRLLKSELEDIPTNPKRLEKLSSFLCDFSTELLSTEQRHNPHYRLAT